MKLSHTARMMRGALTALVTAAMAVGCASQSGPEQPLTTLQPAVTSGTETSNRAAATDAAVQNVDLISVDLVNALSQIKGMHPTEAVIQMEAPATVFGDALKTVLEQAGYGLRVVKDAEPSALLEHAVTRLREEDNGVHNSYQIVIGDVRLKREYFEQAYGVTPSSNMFVIGANPENITLNDELFTLASTQTTDINPLAPLPPEPAREEPAPIPLTEEPVTTLAAAEPVAEPAATETTTAPETAAPAIPQPLTVLPAFGDQEEAAQTFPTQQINAELQQGEPAPLIQQRNGVSEVKIKGNMYELGQSNFTELLANYSDMKQDILVFGNDSMRLGRKNKRTLSTFISDFLVDSDVISVIGCSHGRTSLVNGNAVLATGRAQRVKEALMFAGIPEDRILEEGCWAAEYFDEKMPRRGVVITHKRERRNS